MLRFLADENFNNAILRGLLRRNPVLAITRAQDTIQRGVGDPVLLAWAAEQGMIVLTHDVTTMTDYAYDRVASGQPMPGVFVIAQEAAPGPIIEELLLIIECSAEHDWADQVWYLPLR